MGQKQYEPFYLVFSEYLGTELPGHDTAPYEENRHTAILDHFGRQLDLHYIDEDGDVYFGEINGPWKMKMEFADDDEVGKVLSPRPAEMESYLEDGSRWVVMLGDHGKRLITLIRGRSWKHDLRPMDLEII